MKNCYNELIARVELVNSSNVSFKTTNTFEMHKYVRQKITEAKPKHTWRQVP